MSAYTILLIIALPLGIASGVLGIWVEKKWVKNTSFVLFVLFCIALVLGSFEHFGMLMNEDIVAERRAWREMVERGEIEVYDDCGHLTADAVNYNIEVDKIHHSIKKYGRWSTWYGTGAEDLKPITKEDKQ
jgi:hypothetical protein